MDRFTGTAELSVYSYDPADEHPAWEAMRHAAGIALDAFGWPRAHPGSLDA